MAPPEMMESSASYHLQSGDSAGNKNESEFVTSKNNTQRKLRHRISNVPVPETLSEIFGAASNVVNSIVGAGIIGIPYALRCSGFVLGLILLLLVSYLIDKSLRMVVEMASFHPKLHGLGVLTYEDLTRIPFGRFGYSMVMIGMFILAYGSMIAGLIIVKDTIPVVFGMAAAGRGGFFHAEFVMLVVSAVVVLPLSLMRDMASLEVFSIFSIVATVVMIGFVYYFSPMSETIEEAGGFPQLVVDNIAHSKVFIGLGVISDAMSCHHSAFIVYQSLARKTPKRWSKVTFRSLVISTIMSVFMGVCGYLGFLNETQGDILNNFSAGSFVVNGGRVLLGISMLMTYPLESFVARHCIASVFWGGELDAKVEGPDGTLVDAPKLFGVFDRAQQVTIGIYIATVIPAMLVDDLGPVLSLTGAIGASFLAYIMCGLAYLGLNGEDFLEHCKTLLKNAGYEVDENDPSCRRIELPLVGDAAARIPSVGDIAESNEGNLPTLPSGWKPLWWYLLGYPIWTYAAASGARGTQKFLRELHSGDINGAYDGAALTNSEDVDYDPANVVGPNISDYYMSIFMIVFGTVAAFAGVISIVWMYFAEGFESNHGL